MKLKLPLFFCLFLLMQNAKSQTHPIELHPNNRVASLQMTPTEYSNWKANDQFNNAAVRQALFQDIYVKFQDHFDFIFLILNEDTRPSNLASGQLMKVSNNVTGIGMSTYNDCASYGSAGKLKAVMHLARRDYLRAGPSLHELMHNWGNFCLQTESVSSYGTGLTSFAYQPHWGFTGGSNKGQLGGFQQSTLVANGGGSYSVGTFGLNANGGNSVPYTQFELYLMGMIPLSGVNNFDVFRGITSYSSDGTTDTFQATTRTTYTSASLQTLLGTRNPSSTTSQKNFKLLVICLTDTPLTAAQWSLLDDYSEKFGRTASDGSSTYNFWEATNGLGTMETGNLQNSLNALGVATNEFTEDIRVYPIPAKNYITIETKNNIDIHELAVYNLLGQKINNFTVQQNDNKIEINMGDCPKGIYHLNIKKEDGQLFVKKIIIE
ncbi:MAG TPA: T9SS type A sorting domain-containing protein [Flavobacterium sp.]|uniref:T9SS type A sorting domain-containing protein n=1 Tax=Flavobacterium sp. TaxID=239 RepID=UPI002BCD9AF1|nr:T9SS type A sorting domain-containing protein [Flavobacterium sp.]HSD14911.1 T9SS type A sorting domain-containing protein [Flavobacterium sp.]